MKQAGKLAASLQPNQYNYKEEKPILVLSRETLKGKLKDHKDGKPLRKVADAS